MVGMNLQELEILKSKFVNVAYNEYNEIIQNEIFEVIDSISNLIKAIGKNDVEL